MELRWVQYGSRLPVAWCLILSLTVACGALGPKQTITPESPYVFVRGVPGDAVDWAVGYVLVTRGEVSGGVLDWGRDIVAKYKVPGTATKRWSGPGGLSHKRTTTSGDYFFCTVRSGEVIELGAKSEGLGKLPFGISLSMQNDRVYVINYDESAIGERGAGNQESFLQGADSGVTYDRAVVLKGAGEFFASQGVDLKSSEWRVWLVEGVRDGRFDLHECKLIAAKQEVSAVAKVVRIDGARYSYVESDVESSERVSRLLLDRVSVLELQLK